MEGTFKGNYGPSHDGKPIMLFEVSYDVARQAGGVNTVISTKAFNSVQTWSENYALLGPYNPSSAAIEFEPLLPPPHSEEVIRSLSSTHGITVHYGRWLVKGYPRVYLFELNSPGINSMKVAGWRRDLQGSLGNEYDSEANNAINFGFQVAHFFKAFYEKFHDEAYILGHFHDWLGSVGLIVLKKWGINIPTVYTAHETLLGRRMCSDGTNATSVMADPMFSASREAERRQIANRHWIEVNSAKNATIFTTVSDVLAKEAEIILGRHPDIITPNGLLTEKYSAVHEFQNLHKKYNNVIGEFCRGHFFGDYDDIDLENTLFFFTSSGRRAGYKDKGIDLMIDALAELNEKLKKDGSKLTVVAFIIMPGNTKSYNVESVKGQSDRRTIKETCETVAKSITDKLFEEILRGSLPSLDSLVTQEDLVLIKKRLQLVVQTSRLPPVVTHNLANASEDEVVKEVYKHHLFNMSDDRVKIIYHPEFISSTSPILPIDYNDFVRGCHLGIFPSIYEPWGYTPAECTLSGIPSVTTNITGFASYMNSISNEIGSLEERGIYVIDRTKQSFEESKMQLAECLYRFCLQTRRQRIEQRNNTEQISDKLSWNTMFKSYVTAHSLALSKIYGFDLPHSS